MPPNKKSVAQRKSVAWMPVIEVELWSNYHSHPSATTRNALIEHYIPLVRSIMVAFKKHIPPHVDEGDLLSEGCFGLMDAIKAFDIKREIKFTTFASRRIRGAMLDYIRNTDWVPRLVRTRQKALTKAISKLKREHGREPSKNEVRKELGITKAAFAKIEADSNPSSIFSSTNKVSHKDGLVITHEMNFTNNSDDGSETTSSAKDAFEAILASTHGTERAIVYYYYSQDLTMKEISLIIRMSESRVSQIHSALLAKLKKAIRSPHIGCIEGPKRIRSKRLSRPVIIS